MDSFIIVCYLSLDGQLLHFWGVKFCHISHIFVLAQKGPVLRDFVVSEHDTS